MIFTLAGQLGSDGAEGRVFLGKSDLGDFAIKAYSADYSSARANKLIHKLTLLAELSPLFAPSIGPIFAWPLAVVYRGSSATDIVPQNFVGFAMKAGGDLTPLSAIVERARIHGTPTFTERLIICYYIARGFEIVHHGAPLSRDGKISQVAICVGDVHDENISVNESLIPFFLDCDGYIIRENGVIWDHEFGRPEYSSPIYLKNRLLKNGYVRDRDDDCYGLAVLIFRMLNDWQRPYLYRGAKQLKVEALVRDGRFPYGPGPDMVVPDAEKVLESYRLVISADLKNLFERAFTRGQSVPNASEWVNALKKAATARPDLTKTQAEPPQVHMTPDERAGKTIADADRDKRRGGRGIKVACVLILIGLIILWSLWSHG